MSHSRREVTLPQEAQALLAGDRKAVARVEAWIREVVRFGGWYVPRPAREDVAQEAFLEVWRSISKPEFSVRSSFQGFVRIIAIRTCIRWLREKPPPKPIARAPVGDLESAVAETDLARRILLRLSPGCRRLIRFRCVVGLPYAEIARMLRRSPGALRVQWSQCLRRARVIHQELLAGHKRTSAIAEAET